MAGLHTAAPTPHSWKWNHRLVWLLKASRTKGARPLHTGGSGEGRKKEETLAAPPDTFPLAGTSQQDNRPMDYHRSQGIGTRQDCTCAGCGPQVHAGWLGWDSASWATSNQSRLGNKPTREPGYRACPAITLSGPETHDWGQSP